MALTRKFLSAMGIEAEKIDEIIAAHSDTVNALKEERDEAKKEAEAYKADAEKLPKVQKELDSLKDSDNPFEKKYNEEKAAKEKLQKEFDSYKSEITAKETKAKKENAYIDLLKKAGISEKRLKSILKVSDVDSIEFDENGKIKGDEDMIKSVKEEWADFIEESHKGGVNTPNPNSNSDNKPPKGASKAAEMAAKFHANLYGETKEGK